MIDPVEMFLHYLAVEKGLSLNTLDAYRRDIQKFKKHLDKNGRTIPDFTKQDIFSFLDSLRSAGNQSSTVARNVASLRGFCKFMLMEGMIHEDPVENLSTPKGWKRVPRIIGSEEVSSLLNKPEGHTLSLRDRAILEIMYSSGLRASEVITIRMSDINFQAGYITITGKGSKERVVPMNEIAMDTIKQYIEKSRPEILRKRTSPFLFLARGGRPMTRQRLWQLIKKYAKELSSNVSPPKFPSRFQG